MQFLTLPCTSIYYLLLVFYCEYLNTFSMWVYLVTLLTTHPLDI